MNDDIKNKEAQIESISVSDYPKDVDKNAIANEIHESVVNTDWSHLDNISNTNSQLVQNEVEYKDSNKHRPFFFWFFIAGLIILLIGSSFAGYKYFFDKNKVSSQKIGLSNTLPDDVKAGEVGTFQINISNDNSVPIRDVKIKYAFQKGFTREGETETVTNDLYFGDVLPNTYLATSSEYLFVGSEGDLRKVKFFLTYKVDGSNAEFNKSLEKDVKISTPLAKVEIEGQKDVIENYENVYTFKVKNLSLENFLRSMLVIEMPNGFVIKKEEGKNTNRFSLDSLAVGEEKEFKVTGYFKNSTGQTKNMRGYIATVKEDDELGAIYADDIYEIKVTPSPINYKTEINSNGQKNNYFSKDRDNTLNLTIQNIALDAVSDVNVILTNKLTKEEFKWSPKTDDVLTKINPEQSALIEKLVTIFDVGVNNYTLEVYGKRRGEFNTILLKKSDFSIEGR